MTLPQDDTRFQRDEDAELITGAALVPMFNLNAKNRIAVKNIKFTCDHATSIAIQGSTGGNSDLLIERCQFVSGLSNWDRALNLAGAAGTTGVVVRECRVTAATDGIRITRPIQAKIYDTTVTEV